MDPLSGYYIENVHFLPLRMYYEDTDAGGIVYHSNYLHFAERARTEMLRLKGIDRKDLLKEGFIFVVRNASIDYKVPAVLYDSVHIATKVLNLGNTSITLDQSAYRDGLMLACMNIVLVCVNQAGRPVRINDKIRELLMHEGPIA